ncbi:L-2-hydroxyglutarate oxidase [bacterium]|nr:L-2-hydroxyglutarate oxidase [bacterium]
MSDSIHFDVAIIGGGIVGLATAMALVEHTGSVVVLEAESSIAAHQTGHNSGVIHSGLYYRPDSAKARNCVEGRDAMYRFCAEHGIPFERCGKVVVATRPSELPLLNELERRGRANGLTGLRRLSPAELRELEPRAAGIAALHVPETGIVDYKLVSQAMARIATAAGAQIRTNARVLSIRGSESSLVNRQSSIVLETTKGAIHARFLINCAGLQSDRVAHMCGLDPGLRIIPFRGEYYTLRPERRTLVRNLIYPVADPRLPFLGVHFTRTIDGVVEAGPNAVLALKREGYRWRDVSPRDVIETFTFPGFWRMSRHFLRVGIGETYRSLSKPAFVKALQRLMPEIESSDLIPGGSGVRAQAVDSAGKLLDDFRILESDRMVHVLNAPSPAATASITIGHTIAQIAEKSILVATRQR